MKRWASLLVIALVACANPETGVTEYAEDCGKAVEREVSPGALADSGEDMT